MKTKMFGAGLIAAMLAVVGVSSHAASATGAAAGESIVATASAEAGQTAEVVSPRAPRRAQMTPEKRAEMRAQREKFMAERKAAMEAKALEVVKKYVSDEETSDRHLGVRAQDRRGARAHLPPCCQVARRVLGVPLDCVIILLCD